MSDDQKKSGTSFDMYSFFSRKDVILMIVLILALLGYAVYHELFVPQAA